MASQQDKDEYARKVGRLVQPAKPFPKVPDVFKKKPEYKAGWEAYEKAVQEWIETGRGG